MSLFICDTQSKKYLFIYGIVDDIMVHMLDNKYINNRMKNIKDQLPKDSHFQNDTFHRYLISLTLKDLFINNHSDIYNRYVGILTQHKLCKQKTLNQIVREFIAADMFGKRSILIQFLINSEMYENKYMAYLLYDLLSNDVNGVVDTNEQTMIFDSFPWPIKEYFRDAMKKTAQYTNDLTNFDTNKIPLEQQICLMKVNDGVKEKAMVKLKEIKSKTEDSGTKARQYLDGLLKIPFSIYKKEPILCVMDEIRTLFNDWIQHPLFSVLRKNWEFPEKGDDKITFVEMQHWLRKWNQESLHLHKWDITHMKRKLLTGDKKALLSHLTFINNYIVFKKKEVDKSKKSKEYLKKEIDLLVNELFKVENKTILDKVISSFDNDDNTLSTASFNTLNVFVENIENKITFMNESISNIKSTLDDAVHGHINSKNQVERIIGQWINGEQDGYCFGFEGPPGVGKTSLAKNGLSRCLQDSNGESRPFAFIQIGGDSNGSTLQGHNYTYVGSTWGSIAQILMDNKCMNPIIFIDEVDKISRTEHGREMIGILTHMLDATQNDSFQDKYFNGIDLDLSKVLFILSYNDVDAIDRVLLDRIHRIQFKNLSLDEKITIAREHMLPDIYKKMGLKDMIFISDETIAFIVETYTSEAGVRKLKEKLFEIIGQVNIEILKREQILLELPLKITIDDIRNKYFKSKTEVVIKKIHKENKLGVVNGMWANTLGQGGTLPITAKWFPAGKFLDLKLTGLQEKVMQESMHVAETVAWELTEKTTREEWVDKYDGIHKYGIHIHTGDGAISKDGPSGGAAITTVIYSLLNNRKIKNCYAITGEIDLNGDVNQIGGVDLKILGSIKAGVTHFIYPESNQKDIVVFLEKYKEKGILKDISLYPVSRIEEVLELILEPKE